MRPFAVLALSLLLSWPAYANGEGAGPLVAERSCARTFEAAAVKLKRYGEYPVARYFGPTRFMTIFLDENDGSWSATVTDENMTCLIASGEGWLDLVPTRGDPL